MRAGEAATETLPPDPFQGNEEAAHRAGALSDRLARRQLAKLDREIAGACGAEWARLQRITDLLFEPAR